MISRAGPRILLTSQEAFVTGPKAFNPAAELKGEGTNQPPASYPNYLPVWDNEKEPSVFPQAVITASN
jgi:hypothetical protein